MKYSQTNKPLVCMMTQSTCYNGTRRFTPRGVLWHCTGAPNPTLKRYVQPSDYDPKRKELLELIGTNPNGNDWNHSYVEAGVNAWIGKLADGTVTTLQGLPWDYAPWGCGGGWRGSANNTHIQFEMCEDYLTDRAYFDACYKEGVELTAYLCKMYGIEPHGYIWYGGGKIPTILCHKDSYDLGVGTGHYDVYNWFNKYGKTMDNVRDDVATLLSGTSDVHIYYRAHVQSHGWMPAVHDGEVAGTVGESKRLEAIKITPPDGVELEVDAHIQNIGWKTYKGIVKGENSGTASSDNDPIIGTVGESKRLEAVRIRCTKNTTGKKLKYQVHVQTYGWQAVCDEGETAGTTGVSKRLEAIRIWFE